MTYVPSLLEPSLFSISVADQFSELIHCTGGATNATAAAWPASLLVIAVPFVVEKPYLAQQVWLLNGTLSGNFDIGFYDEFGSKLWSAGSTAQAGSGVLQAVTAAITLPRGRYYLALVFDNGTAQVRRWPVTPTFTNTMKFYGTSEQTLGALPLPATLTFGAPTHDFVPDIGFTLTTLAL